MIFTIRNIFLIIVLFLGSLSARLQAQCTSNPATISSSINFSALSWTGSGCGDLGAADANHIGDVIINIANGATVTMDKNLTITGNFNITNQGNSTMTIPTGITLEVTGDMGNASNNNVTYIIDGVLAIGGTFSGKNGNAFEGSGSVTADAISFNQPPTCGAGCNVSFTSNTCSPAGSVCTDALPITLLFFNAFEDSKEVVLDWATASEENFDFFQIERAVNSSNFAPIGRVSGKGEDSFSIENYSFNDGNPKTGLNYYRLKSIDIDGSFEYSRVALVSVVSRSDIEIYPNPSKGRNLSIRIPESDNTYSIRIFNQTGSVVYESNLNSNINSLSLPGLKKGFYIVRLSGATNDYVTRLVLY